MVEHNTPRSKSFSSQQSDESHTAAEFIQSQLQLEEDAREALPYSIEHCTKPLGSLRQILFACLTCNPPPKELKDAYTPAGVCYACSVQCHGEHTLVELFNKRDFTCDCGSTRLPSSSPCALRIHPETNMKGGVHSEVPELKNKYNQNFRNHFCGCGLDYDPFMQKGTMFQCLGLGTVETGGCGEDWWHPSCVVGLGPDWQEEQLQKGTSRKPRMEGFLESITEVAEATVEEPNPSEDLSNDAKQPTTTAEVTPYPHNLEENEVDDYDAPLPPGFPHEDDFEGFICYKCVDANPWIKRYANAAGFLTPVFRRSAAPSPEASDLPNVDEFVESLLPVSKKRKAEDVGHLDLDSATSAKRQKEIGEVVKASVNEEVTNDAVATGTAELKPPCKINVLPAAPAGLFSLFFKSDFRDHLCRCSDCFPNLAKHPQLLEEEDTYEPPVSNDGDAAGGSTVGSGSIYERGESVLKNIDRVRAIEGVMAYNHLKDKLKPFFQQFAESGKAISAEDIKAHFSKMRGDEQAIKDAGEGAKVDNRREERGY
ncbi:metaphase-anaphase transition protein-like protein mlo2 [Calycina marina]|uniref:Metaphase-anaphase transition protein-like protein mlo2 n=1 Tax=Calycina marina TaxID=1763456 RepID=A0A9P7YYT6_9HELO|nr:metaphase-anaphase transition protein-like protein mlo2 [Calycina marina]